MARSRNLKFEFVFKSEFFKVQGELSELNEEGKKGGSKEKIFALFTPAQNY